jgi:hypothetical protein
MKAKEEAGSRIKSGMTTLVVGGVSADPPTFYEDARANHPRPINGIFVGITVRNCTFASIGRLSI